MYIVLFRLLTVAHVHMMISCTDIRQKIYLLKRYAKKSKEILQMNYARVQNGSSFTEFSAELMRPLGGWRNVFRRLCYQSGSLDSNLLCIARPASQTNF